MKSLQKTIPLEITVTGEVLADKGDGDLWRHARLRWLNSQIGEDREPVTPFLPMKVNGNIIQATEKTFSYCFQRATGFDRN